MLATCLRLRVGVSCIYIPNLSRILRPHSLLSPVIDIPGNVASGTLSSNRTYVNLATGFLGKRSWNALLRALDAVTTLGRLIPRLSRLIAGKNDGVASQVNTNAETENAGPTEQSPIQKLLNNPALFDPIRKPRNPIVLCHGLYGFDVLGPSAYPPLQLHYWSNVLEVLRGKVGAEVIVTGVPGTGSVEARANKMHDFLKEIVPNREINFFAHSMGGLDCRHLITSIRPDTYTPRSLTTISTPHRGSPFMDWCTANIGIGALREALDPSTPHPLPYTLKSPLLSRPTPSSSMSKANNIFAALPSSLTTLLLALFDSPAYSDLTTHYCNNIFNPQTPDHPDVKYFSVAARVKNVSIFHPLWLPKIILDETEAAERKLAGTDPRETWQGADGKQWGNDALVSVESAKWGEFLGVLEGTDHWQMRGAQGFGTAWEKSGRSGKGGWGDFLGWRAKSTAEKESALSSHALDLSSIYRLSSMTGQTMDNGERAKLANSLEWIAGLVPQQLSSILPFSTSDPKTRLDKVRQAEGPGERGQRSSSSIPAMTKFELDKFYIALSRKLYDEGL